MKKAMLVVMFVMAVGGLVMAQTWSSPVDVLGAHNNGGRGCAGCHQPHSGSFGSGQKEKALLTQVAMHCGDRTQAHCMAPPSLSVMEGKCRSSTHHHCDGKRRSRRHPALPELP